jgi:sugar-specific transcriptional regulator TrmB
MASSESTVDKARKLLEERAKELEHELRQIEHALAGLGSRIRRRGPGRPRKSKAASKGSGKQRRRRKGGTRAEHAVKYLEKNPGATAPEIAKSMGIKPNYVYRVMGELQSDGKVRKEGKGYVAV